MNRAFSFYFLCTLLTASVAHGSYSCSAFLSKKSVRSAFPETTEWLEVTNIGFRNEWRYALTYEPKELTDKFREDIDRVEQLLAASKGEHLSLEMLSGVALPVYKKEERTRTLDLNASQKIKERRYVKTDQKSMYRDSLDPRRIPDLKTNKKNNKKITFRRTRQERINTRMPEEYDVPVVKLTEVSDIYLEDKTYGVKLEAEPGSGLLAESEDGVVVEVHPIKDWNDGWLKEQLFLRSIGARPQKVFVSEYQGQWYWGTEIQFASSLGLKHTYSNMHEDSPIDLLFELNHMPDQWRTSLQTAKHNFIELFKYEDNDIGFESRINPEDYARVFKKLISILTGLDKFRPYFFQQSNRYDMGYAVFMEQLLPQLFWYVDAKTGQLGLDITVDLSKQIPTSVWADGNESLGPASPISAAPFGKGGRAYAELIMFMANMDPTFTKLVFDHFYKKQDHKTWWLLVQSIKGWISQTDGTYPNTNLIKGLELVFKEADISDLKITGFSDDSVFSRHFDSHKDDFLNPPQSKEEYYEMALDFIQDTSKDLISVQRADGAYMKYDPETDEFAVVESSGRLITYYILRPDRDNDDYLGRNVHRGRGRGQN